MVTTGMALLLASVAFTSIEIIRFRGAMVRNLSALAGVIGLNTGPALLFRDPDSAEETLSALTAEEHVLAAAVYDTTGAVFARYTRHDIRPVEPPERRSAGHEFAVQHLDLFRGIEIDGEQLGTLFIRSDTREIRERLWQYIGIVAGLMAAASLVSAYGASRLQRRIATPLAALASGSEDMARGDLSTRVEVGGDDQIRTLGRTFNGMVESLRALVSQVGENTRAVAEATVTLRRASDDMHVEAGKQEAAVEESAEIIEKMSASVQEVNSSVEGLATSASETSSSVSHMDQSITEIALHMDDLSETIDGTASTVTQMTTAIREIAKSADTLDEATRSTASSLKIIKTSVTDVKSNAEQNHALSEKAVEQAERGLRRVQETIEAMKKIATHFQGLGEIIERLDESSQSIGQIVKVIEGVVEETNLLSLNAAIISSHAGEHGRAFAVVAQGVKSLAERTAGSTREISSLIGSVRKEVEGAVGAMKTGSQDVEQGVSLSMEAGKMLGAIRDSSAKSASTVSEIAEATGLQVRDIERVDEAMGIVEAIVQQLNRGTHEQDSARADIMRGVDRMRELGQDVKQATQEQKKESRLITQAVEAVAGRVNNILEATTRQRKQGDQILQALEIFREGAVQGTARAEAMKATVQLLSERSKALEEEIGRFHL
jgi:methyl-accepting chemotaxis protein